MSIIEKAIITTAIAMEVLLEITIAGLLKTTCTVWAVLGIMEAEIV